MSMIWRYSACGNVRGNRFVVVMLEFWRVGVGEIEGGTFLFCPNQPKASKAGSKPLFKVSLRFKVHFVGQSPFTLISPVTTPITHSLQSTFNPTRKLSMGVSEKYLRIPSTLARVPNCQTNIHDKPHQKKNSDA